MATIKDVALLAGVSYTTVSHVINNTRVVSDDTREKVEQAIRALGYTPNMVARGLRRGESKTVGVVSISSHDRYFAEILQWIQERGWEEGYGVYISYTDVTEACMEDEAEEVNKHGAENYVQGRREIEHLADLECRNIQGLILNSLLPDEELERNLSSLRSPCVLFERLLRGPRWDNFVGDDFQGTRDAMRHLLSLGHRRIALVSGFGYESHSVKYRRIAWEQTLAEAGIPADPGLERNGRYDAAQAYAETAALLALDDAPTAILYYSDTMALAGIRAAADRGLSVPRDLSVIGYDNLDIDDMTVPRLTSVNQDSARMGREMMERLIERIADPTLESVLKTYPQNLVIRESTGPAPRRG